MAPFVYTGTNLARLTSSGIIDAVAQDGDSLVRRVDGHWREARRGEITLPVAG